MKLTRRELLSSSAATAVARMLVSDPVRAADNQLIQAANATTAGTDFSPPDFTNWPESICYRPRSYFGLNDSLADLASFIKGASQNDRRVRAFGSAWALSDVAVAPDHPVQVGNGHARVLGMSHGTKVWGPFPARDGVVELPSLVLAKALTPRTVASGKLLVHAEAGITIANLYLIIDAAALTSTPARTRWALQGLGGAGGQTLAGAISTSTHGGDFGVPPLPDMVRAIDIIMADGNRYWIERSDKPITSPEALAQVFMGDPLPPIVHYDTDEFLSVLVSFGSMGVICSLVIEVVEQFALSQQVGWTFWKEVRPLLANRTLLTRNPPYVGIDGVAAHPTSATDRKGQTFDTRNAQPWALEVLINPYRTSFNYVTDQDPDRSVLLACRAKFPIADPVPATPASGSSDIISAALINDFKAHDGNAAEVWDSINRLLQSTQARVNSNGFFTAHTITDTYKYASKQPPHTDPLLSIEIVLPTRNGSELVFVDQLLAQFDGIISKNPGDKFAGIWSIRYCKASEAYLSMHNFSPEQLDDGWVCNIEIGCLHNVDTFANRIYGDEDPVGLKDGNICESSSRKHFLAFEQLASERGARLHWGQMSFSNSHNPKQYPNYSKWQSVRDRYSLNGSIRVFDSDFTTRYGISASETSNEWTVVASSRLPGAATKGPAEAAKAAATMPPAAILTAQSCIEIAVIGGDGQVCWTRQPSHDGGLLHWSWIQRPASRVDNSQSGSVPLAPQFAGRVAFGLNSDSHPEVFACCASDSGIYHSWRNLTDNSWNDWTRLKDAAGFVGSPDVALAQDGTLVVIARDASHQVRWTSQNNTLGVVGWNDWANLPPLPGGIQLADPCIARNADGLIEAFVCIRTTVVMSRQAKAEGSSSWSNWMPIGRAPLFGGPSVVGVNSDGTLDVFAVGARAGTSPPQGQLLHIRQTIANPGNHTGFNWSQSKWEPVVDGDQVVASFNDRPSVVTIGGAIHVAMRAADGTIVHYRQQGSGYVQQELGGHFSSGPSIVADSDGLARIFTKFDGDLVQAWRESPASPSIGLLGIGAGGGNVIAVGSSGAALLSSDGIAWKPQATNVNDDLTDAVWFAFEGVPGQFIAVGLGGTIVTSSDGISWTVRKTGPSSQTLSGVAVGVGIVVATSASLPQVYTSTDGITWTLRDGVAPRELLDIVWGRGGLVAVGYGGTIITSPDGISWTTRSSPTTENLTTVVWSGSQYVAGGANGAILSSPDGVAWTQLRSPTSNKINAIASSGNRFVGVTSSSEIIQSTDGANWIVQAPSTTNRLNDVIWWNGMFIAVGVSGTIITSGDGSTWKTETSH